MYNHKSLTFDKEGQEALPQHIKDKMKSNMEEARKKKSEMLKEEPQKVDNDIKAHALMTKSIREARLERFEEFQEKLEKTCIIVPFNGQKVVIDTQTDKFGILDYYPKANRILIRKENTWKKEGLKWLYNNIL